MDKILSLAVGSMAGGMARWFLSEAVARAVGRSFPYGTLTVNLAGCFILGLLYSLGESRLPLSPAARMLLMVGFCGSFTTFSTFMLESSAMADKGNLSGALGYIVVSVLLGFGLFRAGLRLPS